MSNQGGRQGDIDYRHLVQENSSTADKPVDESIDMRSPMYLKYPKAFNQTKMLLKAVQFQTWLYV